MTCKHYYIKYSERTCTQCGQVFYICPVCSKHRPYGWLCVDCENEHRKQAQIEREAAYQLLFDVFTWLEPENRGSGPRLVKHLCDGAGEPVETLAEVMVAVEDGELRCPPRVEWLGEM